MFTHKSLDAGWKDSIRHFKIICFVETEINLQTANKQAEKQKQDKVMENSF